MTQVQWTGLDSMFNRMEEYTRKVEFALVQIATYWAGVFEAYAKENAPWTDRTGNARQTLHGWIDELSHDTVALYLSHGVEYGIHLETKYGGQYAIIWDTIQTHLDQIQTMLEGIFK